ncbi:serine/threonine protein kinase [Geodermatophilus siccatus]|uniref:non-specific serine/threonine protein kinase n=1 Tax=Geodermatophilus siccatus TaxID=1137991 RepID=A0A1G9UQ07_9ACTN|nr:serine/threonine-protein kinase [Geodermatophilus siccatus]SDM61999.1 serine/threonine protein kinase [Geodermatophilus siccatus]
MLHVTGFGPYVLHDLLGRGGMGEVYRAYDREQARWVALKLLPAGVAADQGYVERFKRESYAAAQLNDPHVIPIHRYGEIEGRLYIDMRLVEGIDLAGLIAQEGPLPPARVVRIVEQAARALDAAHARALVHRDVKPSNLLVAAQDFVYLVDFGIAQVGGTGAAPPLTADGSTVGTFDYMAPERLRGREVDGRADVYSLACVLYEALTGQRPFPVDGVPALMHAHTSSPPPRVTALRPDLSPGWDVVVARGMAKDPGERYPTCGALVGDAIGVLQGVVPGHAPVTVVPPAPPTHVPGPAVAPPTHVPPAVPASGWPPAATQPPPRRSRGVAGWLVAAVALVVVAVLTGVLLGQSASGDDAPTGDDAAAGATPPAAEAVAPSPAQESTPGPGPGRASAPTTGPGSTPAPDPQQAEGDLGLATTISSPECDSSWVVFLGSAVDPDTYPEDVAVLLAEHPGAEYLLTEDSCASLRQELDGNRIYSVYEGPYPDRATACAARARVGGDAYVKRLDDTTPPEQLWTC